MKPTFSTWLWLLKLGALANLYFIFDLGLPTDSADLWVVVPAQILLAVSTYRCLFPVRYEHSIVLHRTFWSSIFATRLLATFSEIAYIFLFSLVLRRLDDGVSAWVTSLSWWMVVQVVISQGFVWAAVLTGPLKLYFYEELGWAVIFIANTAASVLLLASEALPDSFRGLIWLNLAFAALYLPWQVFHLRSLLASAAHEARRTSSLSLMRQLGAGLRRQHYGLVRVPGTRVGNRHVWNHMSDISRIVSFELTNHAGHHQDSYTPYQNLVPHPDQIPMPGLFVLFFVALIPPLWHRKYAMPALKRWDLEYASAEERVLAREQNRRAGWPDWIGEAGSNVGKAATAGC